MHLVYCINIWHCITKGFNLKLCHLIICKISPLHCVTRKYAISPLRCGKLFSDQLYFRSHPFFKYTVDYIYHLVTHDVIYSIRHLMNEWDLKNTFSVFPYTAEVVKRWATGLATDCLLVGQHVSNGANSSFFAVAYPESKIPVGY